MLEQHSDAVKPNHFNNYTCERCKAIVKTVDLDNGTTPFTISCRCGNDARSSFYNDRYPERLPDYGWYRPSLKETLKYRKKNKLGMLEHILSGGLDMKEIQPKRVQHEERFYSIVPTIKISK